MHYKYEIVVVDIVFVWGMMNLRRFRRRVTYNEMHLWALGGKYAMRLMRCEGVNANDYVLRGTSAIKGEPGRNRNMLCIYTRIYIDATTCLCSPHTYSGLTQICCF